MARNEQSPGTPGHIEAKLLAVEAAHPGALRADVLKVPHHGSETASTQDFIAKVNPQFVVISASTLHHLPRDTVVQRYVAPQRTILRTDNRAVFNNDHVACWKEIGQALDCNYEAVILETRSRPEWRPLMAHNSRNNVSVRSRSVPTKEPFVGPVQGSAQHD